jgi:predicted lipoprotein
MADVVPLVRIIVRQLVPILLASAVMVPTPPAVALDRAALNRSLALDFAAPRYRALAEATAALRDATTSYCNQSDDGGLVVLRTIYDSAMDAWMTAQPLRLGPITLDERLERLQFWPDKHNSGGRQYAQALQAMDPATAAAIAAGQGTVALQGFPAFERLLFDEKITPGDAADPSGRFRCDLLVAIATNLAAIAADTAREWGDADAGFAKSTAEPGPTNPHFGNEREATAAFLGGFMTLLQVIADQKLLRPLGEDAGSAKPKLAESWRSGRSLRNIELNLRSLRAMYDGAGEDKPGFSAALRETMEGNAFASVIDDAFDRAVAAATSAGAPLEQAIADPARRPAIEKLRAAVKDIQRLAATHLPGPLGVSIGFNSLDGD